jgi:hypothetical protein
VCAVSREEQVIERARHAREKAFGEGSSVATINTVSAAALPVSKSFTQAVVVMFVLFWACV